MKKLSSIFLMLVIGTQVTFARYSDSSQIQGITIYKKGAVVIFKRGVITQRGSCKSSTRFYIDITTPGGMQMLKHIENTASKSGGLRIGYTASKCSNIWGTNSMVEIYSVKAYYSR